MEHKLCSHEGCGNIVRSRGMCANHYQQWHRRQKDPLVGTRTPGKQRSPSEKVECGQDGCTNAVHSKGLCQNHYRQAKRRERGLYKRGPKPDPTKPRSRHREKEERHLLVLGGECPSGHALTEDTVYQYPRNNGSVRLVCKQCRKRNGHKKRLSQYRITEEEYETALEEQDYACKVCAAPFGDTKTDMPHIDHDHSCCPSRRSCGKCFRGLLCSNCNNALGYAKDDPSTLRRLADYLEGTTPEG